MIRAVLAAVLLGACAAAQAQSPSTNPLARSPDSIALGPRLLDYPMECVEPRGCRIECFQNGVKVLSRGSIGQQDEIRLIASGGDGEEMTPRWIEVRPFSGDGVQTLMLSPDSFCDLKSLVISPKNRP